MKKSLKKIKEIYENDLEKFGKNHRGVGWKKKKDAIKRYEIMSKLILNKKRHCSLVDLGCGLSDFYRYLKDKKFKINYTGIDISKKMISVSKKRFPRNRYYCLDILSNPDKISKVDYFVINGLFTQKDNYSNSLMFNFLKSIIKISSQKIKVGLAFNIMSESVDWKNKKNFYVSIKKITDFIIKNISKNFIINHNFGLYEYKIYIYKKIR